MRARALKVGEVARRTGLTVRALHHYDRIGLLRPGSRTESAHRLYEERDIARLQQIASLKQSGFSLDEIAVLLRERGATLRGAITRHIDALDTQIASAQSLRQRLKAMVRRMESGGKPSLDDLLQTIQETTMQERYFTRDQAAQIRARAQSGALRPADVAGREWKQVAAAIRAEYDRKTPPSAPRMQELAHKWQGLIHEITGGDSGIHQGLVAMYRAQPSITSDFFGPTVDAAVLKYIREATAALPT